MAKLKDTEIKGNLTINGDIASDLNIKGDIYDKYNTKVGNGLAVYGLDLDPDTTTEHLILTNSANNPISNHFFYITTMYYVDKTTSNHRAQIAVPYGFNPEDGCYYRNYVNGSWSAWVGMVPSTGGTINGNLTLDGGYLKANNFRGVQIVEIDYNTNTTQDVWIGTTRSVVKVTIALNGNLGYVDDTLYINGGIVTTKRNGTFTNSEQIKYSWNNDTKTLTVTCLTNWSYGFVESICGV